MVLSRLIGALLVLLTIANAHAQLPWERESGAIRAVIAAQLEAFKRDDAATAFAQASGAIQAQFGDADTFLRMVREGYRPVYRPRQVEFAELDIVNGMLAQKVHVVGPDGEARLALYFMEQRADGSWAINGCVLLEEPGKST